MQTDVIVYSIQARLADLKPPIQRDIEVAATTTLAELATLLLTVFDWSGNHPHRFESRRGIATADEEGASLAEALPEKGSELHFHYHPEDRWLVVLRLTDRSSADPGQAYPVVVRGERAGPLEDCGGAKAYDELVKLKKRRARTKEEQQRLAWAGRRFDPEKFDLNDCNRHVWRLCHPVVLVPGVLRRPDY